MAPYAALMQFVWNCIGVGYPDLCGALVPDAQDHDIVSVANELPDISFTTNIDRRLSKTLSLFPIRHDNSPSSSIHALCIGFCKNKRRRSCEGTSMRSITAPFQHSGFHPKTIFTHQGFFAPQLGQKLPSFSVLQFAQTQPVAGAFAPQLVQKLPLFSALQDAQTQPDAGAAAGASAAGASAAGSSTSAPGT